MFLFSGTIYALLTLRGGQVLMAALLRVRYILYHFCLNQMLILQHKVCKKKNKKGGWGGGGVREATFSNFVLASGEVVVIFVM